MNYEIRLATRDDIPLALDLPWRINHFKNNYTVIYFLNILCYKIYIKSKGGSICIT